MSVGTYYLIFALTTSIVLCIDILLPALSHARRLGVRNTFTSSPKLTCFVYFVISAIMAPMLIVPLLVPSMHARFRKTMSALIFDKD